ncbi:hypothetical protein BD410DRAFT_842921 [Rickenella mellea]|uniref:Uncharacterized protein n=1 Tax=Rickenella mellea TaxID=50990 RepID=A0A4Y7PUN2_9AGAM|nr:hypothetical protein BD410DRAFT_842921 [Rickenella mellea]
MSKPTKIAGSALAEPMTSTNSGQPCTPIQESSATSGQEKTSIRTFEEPGIPDKQQIDLTLAYVRDHSPVDVNKLSPEVQKLVQDIRDIVETTRLMVAEKHVDELFKKLIWNTRYTDLERDLSIIGHEVFTRDSMHSAKGIRPDQERLQNVDPSAPRDTFITKGGRQPGRNETPLLEAQVPGPPARKHVHRRRGANQRAVSGGAVDTTHARGQDVRRNVDAAETDEEKKDNLLDRVPQEHKDLANDTANASLPTQWNVAIISSSAARRLVFLFVVLCRQSIRRLLGFFENYASHGKHVAGRGQESHQAFTEALALNTALSELRTLLERFANDQSLQIVIDAANALYADAQSDEELRDWFYSVAAYLRKTLLEPGFVLEPECNNEANRLRDSGRPFYDGKYKGHFDNLFDTFGAWFRAMGDDPLNVRFGQDPRLRSAHEGPALWEDLRKVIMPQLIDQVGYVTVPRIEYTDDALDLVVENLTLQGRNIFPNMVSIEAHNFVKFSPYDSIKDEHHHDFTITMAPIQADMRDVAFYFRKKTGIPKIKDSGLADVVLGGEGLSATVHLSSAGKDRSSVFKVKNVVLKVNSLKFHIRDSKHDTLYNTLRPLATGLVKRQIQKAFADAITTGLEYVDGRLVGVRDCMADAKNSDETYRMQVLQQMFQRKFGHSGRYCTDFGVDLKRGCCGESVRASSYLLLYHHHLLTVPLQTASSNPIHAQCDIDNRRKMTEHVEDHKDRWIHPSPPPIRVDHARQFKRVVPHQDNTRHRQGPSKNPLSEGWPYRSLSALRLDMVDVMGSNG